MAMQNTDNLAVEKSSRIKTPDEVQMLPVGNFVTGNHTVKSFDQSIHILVEQNTA